MTTLHERSQMANRLNTITQRVGFALWQLQELEGASAQHYVLAVRAERGMGKEAGQVLTDKALSETFGTTVRLLTKAKKLPENVGARFQVLLAERNWLVHNSRASSRHAIHDDDACEALIERLDKIAEEAGLLLREVGKYAQEFAESHGVSAATIDRLTSELLDSWHAQDCF